MANLTGRCLYVLAPIRHQFFFVPAVPETTNQSICRRDVYELNFIVCLNGSEFFDSPVVSNISAPSTFDPSIGKVDISSLPSAPRAQREGSFDPSKVPRSPPFTAYVGNLPFDTEDEDVTKMFVKNTVHHFIMLPININ